MVTIINNFQLNLIFAAFPLFPSSIIYWTLFQVMKNKRSSRKKDKFGIEIIFLSMMHKNPLLLFKQLNLFKPGLLKSIKKPSGLRNKSDTSFVFHDSFHSDLPKTKIKTKNGFTYLQMDLIFRQQFVELFLVRRGFCK